MRITNLIVAASAASLVQALPSKREVKDIKKRTASGFTWVGVSESGAEFGSNIPGTLGTDYIWPETDKIAVLREAGMNIFRIPFLMERLTPDSLTGSFASTYLADLKSTVEYVTGTGAYAVLDPHNYGRYDGSIIESTSDFKTWWTNVATEFASNDLVIFDTNNEYHDMEESLVVELNQAAINGIRAAGATTQYIFVEGNAYTGAWSWTEYNDDMSALTDTEDKIIYEMHQYLDSDSSGTSETCVNSTIGQNRLESATEWLKTNGKLGFIGEFAGGVNSVCEEAVEGMLSYMSENSDVWTGAEWWSAGPWWGSYMYSLEPTTGAAYSTYLPILEKYFPANGTTASVAASGSASVAAATSTAAAIQETTTPNGPEATTSAGLVKQYYQCGGINWTGPTECESPYTCKEQNVWYYQCVAE
ncbi:cellulase-domain-containing protein [Aspergillus heteromorphus CBS 117.55]|uniref:cellulase n=1 Tax=Aspergillus heteromorphus CBS 117.55 TaxID=1448321 RepID=A0A317V613_9EURO|nr:cellulase-domain-containing protein [Aspergillus heteromorphus CBS 117.55]PWY68681.1 cellulase-domain-containing protein [Aspergillus heteromorphus CBS 117.55]